MTDFTDRIDVAAERLGGAVLLANDEFFAPKERLLLAAPAEWREGVYTERGKWMDGWETRRRRSDGYDWCIVRLGVPSIVRGVVVDTSWFRGNFPESCSIDAAEVEGTPAPSDLSDARRSRWREILPRQALQGDTRNVFAIEDDARSTHIRLNIYPDGGVARLRVHGDVVPDARLLRSPSGREVNLAAMELGAFVMVCSDMFFGHRQNLILPGRSTHMGDGWETQRRRGPGHDWTIVRLAARGSIERVEIDTDHYKGNAPGSCAVDVCDAADATAEQLTDPVTQWSPLIAQTPLQPHARHSFDAARTQPVTHVRLSIYPDGGIARLRVYGLAATSS
jgi:allantoicase